MKYYCFLVALIFLSSCSSQSELLDIELWGQWLDSTETWSIHFKPETKDTVWVNLPDDTARWYTWQIKGQTVQIGPYNSRWESDSPFGVLWLGELKLEQSRGVHVKFKGIPGK